MLVLGRVVFLYVFMCCLWTQTSREGGPLKIYLAPLSDDRFPQ